MIFDRLHRAIRLLQLLQQSDGLSLREIAAWLDCSQRTVYRDLQLLKESGFEVEWTRQGYRIDDPDQLPRAALDNDEIMSILATIGASPLVKDERVRRHLQSGMQKLMAACTPKTRVRWLQLYRRLSQNTSASAPPQNRLFSQNTSAQKTPPRTAHQPT